MLKEIPSAEELRELLGGEAFAAWNEITAFLGRNYSLEIAWDTGRKAGKHECKFRR